MSITAEALALLNNSESGTLHMMDYRLDKKKLSALRRLVREGRIFSMSDAHWLCPRTIFIAPGVYCPLNKEA